MRNVAFHDILYLWLYNRLVDRELSKNFLVDPSQRQVGHPWSIGTRNFWTFPMENKWPCLFVYKKLRLLQLKFPYVCSDGSALVLCCMSLSIAKYDNTKLARTVLSMDDHVLIRTTAHPNSLSSNGSVDYVDVIDQYWWQAICKSIILTINNLQKHFLYQ